MDPLDWLIESSKEELRCLQVALLPATPTNFERIHTRYGSKPDAISVRKDPNHCDRTDIAHGSDPFVVCRAFRTSGRRALLFNY